MMLPIAAPVTRDMMLPIAAPDTRDMMLPIAAPVARVYDVTYCCTYCSGI